MKDQSAPKLLETKLAALESQLDMMETELSYLNEILVECGFPQGINTLRKTVEDLIQEQRDTQK
ncbi:MAG: hypothetical protein FJZ56_02935 [Chlamydiae bacterium]|nr:hypothetical protein [Chlamydiota bacterium]